jgi:hypothetical protein
MCLNETCSEVRTGNHLCDNFPIQNGLKQGDDLLSPLFNFSLEYDTRKVPENQVGLKLNGTHKLLVYSDIVNLLGDNVDTIKKNTETLIDDSKELGLEFNIGKSNYCNMKAESQNNEVRIGVHILGNCSLTHSYYGINTRLHNNE